MTAAVSAPADPSPRSRRLVPADDWWLAAAVTALLLFVYLASPQRRFLDSKFALLSSHALLERGSLDLSPYRGSTTDGYEEAEEADEDGEAEAPGRIPYQLLQARGRLLYLYSPGTAILSAPFVAVLRVAGYGAVDERNRYSGRRERDLQGVLAAWLTATSGLLVFWAARRELAAPLAAVVALATGLGSGLWSAASRVMWTHTWSSLLIAAAWLELLRWEDGERRRGWLLGTLLAALFWVRPTGALVAAAVALYVLLRHRRALAGVLLAGAAGLLAYVALAYELWGSFFPPYFRVAEPMLEARPRAFLLFFELLVSPGHGLLAFSPILLLVIWWLARHGVPAERRPLALLAGAIAFAYVVLYSRWGWGGTVGPRFLCDPTAVLAWLGACAWRRARERGEPPRRRFVRAAAAAPAVLLLAASVAAHGVVAWDVSVPGRSRAQPQAPRPAPPAPSELRSLFDRPMWQWRSLPQLRLSEVLATLERRRQGGRRIDRRPAAPATAPDDDSAARPPAAQPPQPPS